MGPETVNKNKDCEFNGPYAGRDLYITMYQDSEREFVVTHNANIKPVSYFTGRETELQELRQRVEEGRKSVLVSGMGGIGKTHICRKLFEEYLNKHARGEHESFRHIGYIEYNGDMDSSLQNCLKFKQQDSPERNREAAWKELKYLAADGKLLLFVDNVDKPISADTGLQRLKGIPGAVVLTSRQASFSDEFESYRIGFLEMEQCKEIYGKIRFEGSDRKIAPGEVGDLEYIIENLAGRHTITVELLAHMARTKIWEAKRLREELEQKGFRLEFHKDGELVNIQESYEKLYDLSELTEAEQNILEVFSVFPYIPLAAETCNEWLLEDAGVSEDDDILIGLYQKGWLQFDIKQESYALHPVFAQFIYEKCKPNAEKHIGLIEACQKSLKIPKSGSILECKQYIPYAENIVEKVWIKENGKKSGLVDTIAYVSLCIAEYGRAEKLYKELLEIYRNTDNYSNFVVLSNNLSVVYLKKGQYKKAEDLIQQTLAVLKNKKVGEDEVHVLDCYEHLAAVYIKQTRYIEAEELYIKIISASEQKYVENQSGIERYCNNLAYVYLKQARYVEAKKLLINVLKQKYEANDLNIAIVFDNLAQVEEAQEQYENAENYYKKGLDINTKRYGENHPLVAISYYNLAGLYRKQKQYQNALKWFIEAYKIQQFNCELDYRDTITMYQSLRETFFEWYPEGDFAQWLEEQMKEPDRN